MIDWQMMHTGTSMQEQKGIAQTSWISNLAGMLYLIQVTARYVNVPSATSGQTTVSSNLFLALSPQVPELPWYRTEGVSSPGFPASYHRPSLHWPSFLNILSVLHCHQHTPLETFAQQPFSAAIEHAHPTLVGRLSYHAACLEPHRTARTARQATRSTPT